MIALRTSIGRLSSFIRPSNSDLICPTSKRDLLSKCSPAAVIVTRHQATDGGATRHPSGWIHNRTSRVDSSTAEVKYNEPLHANDLPRTAGICSMYRLPVASDTKGLDVCFVGVPLDIGTSNRPGARFGPRQIRNESLLIRRFNQATGASPYESLQVADVGDVNMVIYKADEASKNIRDTFSHLLSTGCKTFAIGGDHSITYPILQAYKERYGPVGLVHIDAHSDVQDHANGCKIQHGTPFRRAVEESLIDSHRTVQIGIRGTSPSMADIEWSLQQGFRVVPADHCHYKSLNPLMEEVRQMMGDKPVYISFDIDGLDPAFAPGTGTPEIGGLTTIQVLEIIRGCRGMNVVGGDLVEVSPPYDPIGNTALTAANFLFEMLCVLPGVKYYPIPATLG